MNTKSDNAYSGGITYSTPAFILGGTGSVNGGYNFDLPLATVASFNTQALDFLASNTSNSRGFLQSVIDGNNNAMNYAENRAFSLAEFGVQTASELSWYAIDTQQQINVFNQEQATIRAEMIPEPDSGGFCFITTAVCEAENLPDDCEELTILRKFRDDYMLKNPGLRVMVDKYYQIAPAVVEQLKTLPNGGKAVFAYLKANYIVPAIAAIKSGHYVKALAIYRAMVDAAESITKGK